MAEKEITSLAQQKQIEALEEALYGTIEKNYGLIDSISTKEDAEIKRLQKAYDDAINDLYKRLDDTYKQEDTFYKSGNDYSTKLVQRIEDLWKQYNAEAAKIDSQIDTYYKNKDNIFNNWERYYTNNVYSLEVEASRESTSDARRAYILNTLLPQRQKEWKEGRDAELAALENTRTANRAEFDRVSKELNEAQTQLRSGNIIDPEIQALRDQRAEIENVLIPQAKQSFEEQMRAASSNFGAERDFIERQNQTLQNDFLKTAEGIRSGEVSLTQDQLDAAKEIYETQANKIQEAIKQATETAQSEALKILEGTEFGSSFITPEQMTADAIAMRNRLDTEFGPVMGRFEPTEFQMPTFEPLPGSSDPMSREAAQKAVYEQLTAKGYDLSIPESQAAAQTWVDLFMRDGLGVGTAFINRNIPQAAQRPPSQPMPINEAQNAVYEQLAAKGYDLSTPENRAAAQTWVDYFAQNGIQAGTSILNQNVPQTQPSLSQDKARQLAEQLITTAGYTAERFPERIDEWANYIRSNGVEAAVKQLESQTGVPFGLRPEYSQGKRYTYDTTKEIVDTLYESSGVAKTGFYDDGRNADEIYNSWIAYSQNRPIEETIKLWNSGLTNAMPVRYKAPDERDDFGNFIYGGANITKRIDDILAKEPERQDALRQGNVTEFFTNASFVTSGAGDQRPFIPGQTPQPTTQPFFTPLQPTDDLTEGVFQGRLTGPEVPLYQANYPAIDSLYPAGQFQPQGTFQPTVSQQPTTPQQFFQTGYQPQFQTPSATPLITQAQRPTLDQTVQFIESGGMSPRTGVQPMQPLSPYDVGSTFQAQTEPYFVRPDVATGIDQMTADQLTATQAFPVTPNTYYGLAAPIPGQGGYTMVPTTGITPTAGMRSGGEVGGLKAAAQQLQSMGRGGDTMLAHITPQEAGLLKAMGGSGTINPKTGLREFMTGLEMAFLGLMGFGTAMTIQEQRKQRKAFEAEQNRQRQDRMQQLAMGQAAYERSGLKDIPLESSPMRGATVDPMAKFDPAMGGVRVGEGVSQIPIPQQSAQTLQPPSTIPATPMMDEEERRRRGMAQGGMPTFEYGGTTGQTGEPRMVKGAGDGMSDNVPATIEGVQEARLANDEFVIPADVVADIGNGSSSSGAQKLYAMMDRVRKARHGTTEQPPEINAEQYMPS
jgi:hypothetical protein